jgi:hypothetical protein
MEIPQKTRIELPSDPAVPFYILKGNESVC